MNQRRLLVIGATSVLGIALLTAAFVQHGQLSDLRAKQQQILDQAAVPSDGQTAQFEAAPPAETTAAIPSPAPSSELLKLRNQVSQLTDRKRQLLDVRAENERLRAQLASRGTNTLAGRPLPPGYIRKSEARWAGFNTPENTVQSFLWAMQNRDLTNMLQALTPKSAAEMMEHVGKAPEEFFQQISTLPGMRVANLHQLPDGSFEGQMEIVPGETMPERVHFLLIDGQWRMDMP